jgi:hypothetical protein
MLLSAGREVEAREWFSRSAEVDLEGETDAADRLMELDGIVLDSFDDETVYEPVNGETVNDGDDAES